MLGLNALNILKRRLTSVVAFPPLLMLLLCGVSIWQIDRLLLAMSWVEHTDWVISQANIIQRLITDEESGIRGYLLTGELEFLEPYKKATSLLEAKFAELGNLVSDNPPQVERLAEVNSEYRQWSQNNSFLIELGKKRQLPSQSVLKARQHLMKNIRTRIGEFIEIEERLRDRRVKTVGKTTLTVTGTSLLLTVILGTILAIFIERQISSISQTYEQALKAATEQTEASQRSARRLANLHQIDRAILSAKSIRSLAEGILEELKNLTSYQQGTIILFDLETNRARVLAGEIPGQPPIAELSSELMELCQSDCYIKDLLEINPRPSGLEAISREGYRSFLALGIHLEEILTASICLFGMRPDAFSEGEREVVAEVADQLAIAIQQTQLREKLQRNALELEEKIAERTAKLQETSQEMEAFAYSVSHDLRAPLRTIEGFAQALLEDYGDRLDDTGKEYTRYLIDGARQMDTLIADLLAYSRLSRAEIHLRPVNLKNIVEQAIEQLKLQIQDARARISIEISSVAIMAHPATLMQSLINLISNAIKFVEPGNIPEIRIWRQDGPNEVKLWIEDNGIGIAPEHQERIFKVFERLHGIETYPGTGIGLAIVRKGIERMGGRVGVESRVKEGSRFWIELPIARDFPIAP